MKNRLIFASVDMLVQVYSNRTNPDGTGSMPSMSGNQFVGKKGQTFGVLSQGNKKRNAYDLALISISRRKLKGRCLFVCRVSVSAYKENLQGDATCS